MILSACHNYQFIQRDFYAESEAIMNYRINVFEVKNSDNNVKAYANVAFGESFVVRNIAIVAKGRRGSFCGYAVISQ